MQHCAAPKKFVTSAHSQGDLPYQGAFSSFGTIQCSHFCCTAIAGHKDTPQLPNYLRNYIVHIFTMQKKQVHDLKFYLAITQDHPVRNMYCKFIPTTHYCIVSMSSSTGSDLDSAWWLQCHSVQTGYMNWPTTWFRRNCHWTRAAIL